MKILLILTTILSLCLGIQATSEKERWEKEMTQREMHMKELRKTMYITSAASWMASFVGGFSALLLYQKIQNRFE